MCHMTLAHSRAFVNAGSLSGGSIRGLGLKTAVLVLH